MSDRDDLGGRFTFPGTSLTVKRIGYGAMQLTGPNMSGPPKDHNAALAVLREAVASGVDHIDTADFYGPQVANHLIREALHPYPDDLVIVTKIGARRPKDGSSDKAAALEKLTKATHDNLRNLSLDVLDIVNLRVIGSGPQSIAEHLDAAAELQRIGLIRHVGLSGVSARDVAEARDILPIVCIQNRYNILQREDDAIIADLSSGGIAYVPYFPLGGYTPIQSATLSAVAARLGAEPLQVAQAWLLHRSPNILLIPGTSSVPHLRQNLAVGGLKLSPDDLLELDPLR